MSQQEIDRLQLLIDATKDVSVKNVLTKQLLFLHQQLALEGEGDEDVPNSFISNHNDTFFSSIHFLTLNHLFQALNLNSLIVISVD